MPPNWLFAGRPGVKETVSLWVKVLASYTLVAALTRPLLLSNLKFSQEVESMWLCRDMGGAVSIISSFVPNLQPTEPTSQRQAARNQLGKLGNGDSSELLKKNVAENVDSNQFLVPFLRKQTAMHPSKLRAPMGKVTDAMLTATEEAARWKRRRMRRQKQLDSYIVERNESREKHTGEGRKGIQADVMSNLKAIIEVQVVKLQRMVRRKILIPKRNERRQAAAHAAETAAATTALGIPADPSGSEMSPLSAIGSPTRDAGGAAETDTFPHYIDQHLKDCEAGATAIQSHFRGSLARHTHEHIDDHLPVLEVDTGRPKTSTGRPKTSGRVAEPVVDGNADAEPAEMLVMADETAEVLVMDDAGPAEVLAANVGVIEFGVYEDAPLGYNLAGDVVAEAANTEFAIEESAPAVEAPAAEEPASEATPTTAAEEPPTAEESASEAPPTTAAAEAPTEATATATAEISL